MYIRGSLTDFIQMKTYIARTRGSSSHRVVQRGDRCSARSFHEATFGPALRMRTVARPRSALRPSMTFQRRSRFSRSNRSTVPAAVLLPAAAPKSSCRPSHTGSRPAKCVQQGGPPNRRLRRCRCRLHEPRRPPVRLERAVTEGTGMHEDEQMHRRNAVTPHLLSGSHRIARADWPPAPWHRCSPCPRGARRAGGRGAEVTGVPPRPCYRPVSWPAWSRCW